MAKVNLTVQAQLRPTDMRKLNPHLRRKGLTIQQAIEKGLKKRIPMLGLNTAVFLAAIEGVGVDLSTNKRRRP